MGCRGHDANRRMEPLFTLYIQAAVFRPGELTKEQ